MLLDRTVSTSLGLSHCEDLIEPRLSWRGPPIEKISCGGNHTALLLQDKSLYGCGDNSCHQLGSREEETWTGWRAFEDKFLDVTCGWEFTAMINLKNELLTRGRGLKGELGTPNTKQAQEPVKVMNVRPGSKLFSSFQNCVVVEPTGSGSRVLGWGSNTKCQLRTPKCRILDHPVVLYQSENCIVDYVAMGKDFMVLVDIEGFIVHTCGLLPPGFSQHEWEGKSVHVSCMWSSLHIWPGPGATTIFSYGNGKHGQLFTAPHRHAIETYATGSEHGIVATTTGGVLCWGWGEHGNCGRVNGSGCINDYSNVISPLNCVFTTSEPASVTLKVYGGCASTWIIVTE